MQARADIATVTSGAVSYCRAESVVIAQLLKPLL